MCELFYWILCCIKIEWNSIPCSKILFDFSLEWWQLSEDIKIVIKCAKYDESVQIRHKCPNKVAQRKVQSQPKLFGAIVQRFVRFFHTDRRNASVPLWRSTTLQELRPYASRTGMTVYHCCLSLSLIVYGVRSQAWLNRWCSVANNLLLQ